MNGSMKNNNLKNLTELLFYYLFAVIFLFAGLAVVASSLFTREVADLLLMSSSQPLDVLARDLAHILIGFTLTVIGVMISRHGNYRKKELGVLFYGDEGYDPDYDYSQNFDDDDDDDDIDGGHLVGT